MFKVARLNPIASIGTDLFTGKYETTENLAEASAVLVRSASMHELELPDGLLAIARAGAGVNNIPLDECAKKGIVVFNAPGANANGVKEMVLAGMLMAARDIYGGITWVRENKDEADIAKLAEKAKKNFAGTEIQGKTLGVIGLGAIGALVANASLNLGMRVMGYDPYISVEGAWSLDHHVQRVNNLDDIYANCDYITIHVPAMDGTIEMIDEAAIAKMKDGVVFLNFARDLLVKEEAMAAALEAGKVRRYVSDFANPVSANMKNAIILPHLAASTAESEDNCAVMAVRELMNYLEAGNIVNSVNFPRTDLGPIRGTGRISIFHKNIPNMIGQITAILYENGINIENMTDKSRGEYAYGLIDVDCEFSADLADKIRAIDGVSRVRLIEAKNFCKKF